MILSRTHRTACSKLQALTETCQTANSLPMRILILLLWIFVCMPPATSAAGQVLHASKQPPSDIDQTPLIPSMRHPSSAQAIAQLAEGSVRRECEAIGHKLGSVSVAACHAAELQATDATSVQGQPILMREFPPLGDKSPNARVLLVGGTHGDEYSSVSVVFKWIKTLSRYHSGLFHWHIVPLLNPDGLLQRHSSRLNANGVDLNRNFPTPDWYAQTRDYWERRTGHDPRRYPGEAALSEPESRWLYEEIRSFKPDVIISVHAPYGVLDFDGPPKAPNRMGYLHLNLLGTYPGSLGNCAGVQHRIPVITMELPSAGIMPSSGEISRMWTDMIRWMIANLPKQDTQDAYASFDSIEQGLNPQPEPDRASGG
ncbi:MAG: M14 family murein peptide amidase A [Mariprofundaceae bacterium]|nr:M14 family murein peptide amidase A [Mariprofundaceae bacterium]